MPSLITALRRRAPLAALLLFLLVTPVAGAQQERLRPVAQSRASAVFDLHRIPVRALRGATLVARGRTRHVSLEALRRAIAKRYVRIDWTGRVSVATVTGRSVKQGGAVLAVAT